MLSIKTALIRVLVICCLGNYALDAMELPGVEQPSTDVEVIGKNILLQAQLRMQEIRRKREVARGVLEPFPFHAAACRGDVETVAAFLEKGFDFRIKDVSGFTPLHWAAKNNQVAVLFLFMRWFAEQELLKPENIDIQTRGTRKTPLCLAVEAGCFEAARVLLGELINQDPSKYLANPIACDNTGTPVFVYAEQSQNENIKKLFAPYSFVFHL